jgi:hypothetical protein
MWGGDIFPADKDPSGDPETWTFSELRRWLEAVGDVLCDLLITTDDPLLLSVISNLRLRPPEKS